MYKTIINIEKTRNRKNYPKHRKFFHWRNSKKEKYAIILNQIRLIAQNPSSAQIKGLKKIFSTYSILSIPYSYSSSLIDFLQNCTNCYIFDLVIRTQSIGSKVLENISTLDRTIFLRFFKQLS